MKTPRSMSGPKFKPDSMLQAILNLVTALLKFAFILAAACSLGAAFLLYGAYRMFGGRSLQAETRLRTLRARSKSLRAHSKNLRARSKNSDQDWLKLKLLGAEGARCPHCRAALEADHDLCPECYADLKRTCPGCGEPVSVQRRICPFCNHDLRR